VSSFSTLVTFLFVIARSEILRLRSEQAPQSRPPPVFARSRRRRSNLSVVLKGRRLPRPDKSGLAMTHRSCHCEAGEASRSNPDGAMGLPRLARNETEGYYPMLQTYEVHPSILTSLGVPRNICPLNNFRRHLHAALFPICYSEPRLAGAKNLARVNNFYSGITSHEAML
jgi:hypothetical protein